jgi:glucosamine-6-phosphate deaminase
MVVWGGGKRLTLSRMQSAERYEPDWPATVIHECAQREIWADKEAARQLEPQSSSKRQ